MQPPRSSIKRWHPYLGEWVIIAPVTAGRPWNGTVVRPASSDQPSFDPTCYLCPGVTRASGAVNPDYSGAYIFTNDFPSISLDGHSAGSINPLYGEEPARGICRVVCFSPRHDATLPMLSVAEVTGVVDAIATEYRQLAATPGIEYVMPFENRGAVIGVSNPHPHGQIYCTDFVPRIPWTMYSQALNHRREHGRCIFCNVLEGELRDKGRIVCENDHAVAFVPPFARHTYEVHLMPRRHEPFLIGLSTTERSGFAALYHEMLVRYDNLFRISFPNITIFSSAPSGAAHDPDPYHFHIEFYPPLRSPDKLKYMAGFESGGGNIINPSLPEESAAALRASDTVHFARIV